MFDNRAQVLAIVASASRPWHEVAGLLETTGSASRVLDQSLPDDLDDTERAIAAHAAETVTSADIQNYCQLIGTMEQEGARLVTVLDKDYPALLREIYNRPPFLFVRGELSQADELAVSVVGTRQPNPEGLDTARRLAAGLAARGVTVVSGLAAGIDTAAHQAALEAGGRTIAVLGTGIRRIYPAQNTALAERIVQRGAVVSQFWPDAPPTRSLSPCATWLPAAWDSERWSSRLMETRARRTRPPAASTMANIYSWFAN